MTISAFDDYLNSLSQLSNPFDPTVPTADSEEIRTVAGALAALKKVDRKSLADFIAQTPDAVPVLGLAVGLTREKLKNVLKHHLGSAGWVTLARARPSDLVDRLDKNYDAVRLINEQRARYVRLRRCSCRACGHAAHGDGRWRDWTPGRR